MVIRKKEDGWLKCLRLAADKWGINDVAGKLDVRENSIYRYLAGSRPCEKNIRKILRFKI